jgi:hypothetical protein
MFGTLFNRSTSLPFGGTHAKPAERQKSVDQLGAFARYGRKEKFFRNVSVDEPTYDSDTHSAISSGVTSDHSNLSRPVLTSSERDYDHLSDRRGTVWEPEQILFQGYLTKKGGKSGIAGESWKNRYFVLRVGGLLYYYKDKETFLQDPNRSVKDRPIQTSMYKVKVRCYDTYLCKQLLTFRGRQILLRMSMGQLHIPSA